MLSGPVFYTESKIKIKGWSARIIGKVFALHMANPGSILDIPSGPRAVPEVITECRIKSNICESPGVTNK